MAMMFDRRIVFHHLPTAEAVEQHRRKRANEFLDKWTIEKLPKNFGDLRKMIEAAMSFGFTDGVNTAIDRVNELQKSSSESAEKPSEGTESHKAWGGELCEVCRGPATHAVNKDSGRHPLCCKHWIERGYPPAEHGECQFLAKQREMALG